MCGRIKRAKIKQDLDEKGEEVAHMENAVLCLMSRWEGTHLGMTSSLLISPSASLRHATSWVSKIYRGRDNSLPAESPAFPTGSRSIRTDTFSMTLNRIWLSGSAPSRLIQRSSTMPGSSSTSLRGSVRDPRAWPQLWDSYLQTQIIRLAFFIWLTKMLTQMLLMTFTVRVSSFGSRTRKWKPSSHRGDVERSQTWRDKELNNCALISPRARAPSYLGSVRHVFEENISPDFWLLSTLL